MKVQYDCCGRMKFNSAFHKNNGTPWSKEDLEYLINWYDKIRADEMSFALGRTMTTISSKVTYLRKCGIMPRAKNIRHKRTYGENC